MDELLFSGCWALQFWTGNVGFRLFDQNSVGYRFRTGLGRLGFQCRVWVARVAGYFRLDHLFVVWVHKFLDLPSPKPPMVCNADCSWLVLLTNACVFNVLNIRCSLLQILLLGNQWFLNVLSVCYSLTLFVP